MAALTVPYESFEKPGLVVNYKISNVKIFKGGLIGINASGYAIPLAHGTASLKFVGVANESIDNSAGAAGDKSLNATKSGSFVFRPRVGSFPPLPILAKKSMRTRIGRFKLPPLASPTNTRWAPLWRSRTLLLAQLGSAFAWTTIPSNCKFF